MQIFSIEELKQRAFRRAAYVMNGMWQEKGSSDTRLLLAPLIPDEFVEVGESLKGRGHREHVVPRVVICDHCHSMFRKGASVEEVGDFMRKFVKVVNITKAEQSHLDGKGGLGLKSRMPDGWTFEGGDVFARLKAAGIEYRIFADAS